MLRSYDACSHPDATAATACCSTFELASRGLLELSLSIALLNHLMENFDSELPNLSKPGSKQAGGQLEIAKRPLNIHICNYIVALRRMKVECFFFLYIPSSDGGGGRDRGEGRDRSESPPPPRSEDEVGRGAIRRRPLPVPKRREPQRPQRPQIPPRPQSPQRGEMRSLELQCVLEDLATFFTHDVQNIYIVLIALSRSFQCRADVSRVNAGPRVPVVNTDLMSVVLLFMEIVDTFKKQLCRSREKFGNLIVLIVFILKQEPAGPDQMLLTPQRLSELREHSAILAVCYRNRRRLQDDDLQELARMFSCEIMYSNASCLELIKRLTGGTLYEGTQIFSEIPYFEITSTNTMLPCLETLYLWNTLAAQSDDDLLAICMLELIEEARQYIYYNDLPTGISQQTKKASLDFIRGCCLQRLGKRGQAMKCFRNISSLERNEMAFNDIEDDFLILIALLEEALYYYDQGVEVTAQLIISYVLNVYDNMSRGARTFCIAFAKIMKVNLRFPG
ncbi:Tetratricopeptide repeat protein 39A [Papilio machaon]|uniref:Tetratricopeptide repeat protein 39A n=1 Tax=Papilio machaon TaxID=76193 RepID=A0A194QVI4_PAPMA|nr:Tetratricopeptide repeat protein 39A [Papilio machaon]